MSIIKNIKKYFWKSSLNKGLKKVNRKRQAINLNDARKIGIIYDASDEPRCKSILEFVQLLQGDQKKIKTLGFANFKIIPHYCNTSLSNDFFCIKDLNWCNIPKSKFIDDFLKTEYDLIIDLSPRESLPLSYISIISNAKFKVGRYNEDVNHLDLMIHNKNNKDLKEFIKHTIHYLTILNIKND